MPPLPDDETDPVADDATDDATEDATGDASGDVGLSELDAELTDLDLPAIEREEQRASKRLSSIEAGRRKGGAAGAAMAGAMLALQDIYEGPPKDDGAIEVEASGEPGDIDSDGIQVTVGDVDVWAPPPGGGAAINDG